MAEQRWYGDMDINPSLTRLKSLSPQGTAIFDTFALALRIKKGHWSSSASRMLNDDNVHQIIIPVNHPRSHWSLLLLKKPCTLQIIDSITSTSPRFEHSAAQVALSSPSGPMIPLTVVHCVTQNDQHNCGPSLILNATICATRPDLVGRNLGIADFSAVRSAVANSQAPAVILNAGFPFLPQLQLLAPPRSLTPLGCLAVNATFETPPSPIRDACVETPSLIPHGLPMLKAHTPMSMSHPPIALTQPLLTSHIGITHLTPTPREPQRSPHQPSGKTRHRPSLGALPLPLELPEADECNGETIRPRKCNPLVLRFATWNSQGMGEGKLQAIISFMRARDVDFLTISEPRLPNTKHRLDEVRFAAKESNFSVIVHISNSASQGVLIFVKSSWMPFIHCIQRDDRARALAFTVRKKGTDPFLLIGVYSKSSPGQSQDSLDEARATTNFTADCISQANKEGCNLIIVLGDLNVPLQPRLDTLPGLKQHFNQVTTPGALEISSSWRQLGLVDSFRSCHPYLRKASWTPSNPLYTSSRLDYILLSPSASRHLLGCCIATSSILRISDHLPCICDLDFNVSGRPEHNNERITPLADSRNASSIDWKSLQVHQETLAPSLNSLIGTLSQPLADLHAARALISSTTDLVTRLVEEHSREVLGTYNPRQVKPKFPNRCQHHETSFQLLMAVRSCLHANRPTFDDSCNRCIKMLARLHGQDFWTPRDEAECCVCPPFATIPLLPVMPSNLAVVSEFRQLKIFATKLFRALTRQQTKKSITAALLERDRTFLSKPGRFFQRLTSESSQQQQLTVLVGTDNFGAPTTLHTKADVDDALTKKWRLAFGSVANPPPNLTGWFEPLNIDVTRYHDILNPIDIEELDIILASTGGTSAPGPDHLYGRVIALGAPCVKEAFLAIINYCLTHRIIPDCWRLSETILIPKDPLISIAVQTNHRPIALLNAGYKLLERAILKRLCSALEANACISPQQRGFVAGGGCYHHTNVIADVLEDSLQFDSEIHILSWDVSKAFDTVEFEVAAAGLLRWGLPSEFISFYWELMHGRSMKIRTGLGLTPSIPLTRSVLQGSVLGPVLFLAVIGPLLHALAKNEAGYTMRNGPHVSCLGFADDIITIAATNEGRDTQVHLTLQFFADVKLKPNCSKTQYLTRQSDTPTDLFIGLDKVTPSSKLQYLGVWFDIDCSWSTQMQHIKESIRPLIESSGKKRLTIPQAKALLESCIIPKLLYPLLIAAPSVADINALETCIDKFIKSSISIVSSTARAVLHSQTSGMGFASLNDSLRNRRECELYVRLNVPGLPNLTLRSRLSSLCSTLDLPCPSLLLCPPMNCSSIDPRKFRLTLTITSLSILGIAIRMNPNAAHEHTTLLTADSLASTCGLQNWITYGQPLRDKRILSLSQIVSGKGHLMKPLHALFGPNPPRLYEEAYNMLINSLCITSSVDIRPQAGRYYVLLPQHCMADDPSRAPIIHRALNESLKDQQSSHQLFSLRPGDFVQAGFECDPTDGYISFFLNEIESLLTEPNGTLAARLRWFEEDQHPDLNVFSFWPGSQLHVEGIQSLIKCSIRWINSEENEVAMSALRNNRLGSIIHNDLELTKSVALNSSDLNDAMSLVLCHIRLHASLGSSARSCTRKLTEMFPEDIRKILLDALAALNQSMLLQPEAIRQLHELICKRLIKPQVQPLSLNPNTPTASTLVNQLLSPTNLAVWDGRGPPAIPPAQEQFNNMTFLTASDGSLCDAKGSYSSIIVPQPLHALHSRLPRWSQMTYSEAEHIFPSLTSIRTAFLMANTLNVGLAIPGSTTSSFKAELWGIISLLASIPSNAHILLVTDSLSSIQAVSRSQRGLAARKRLQRPSALSLLCLEQLLSNRSGSVTCVFTPSHQSRQEAVAHQIPLLAWSLNRLADTRAQAAQASQPPIGLALPSSSNPKCKPSAKEAPIPL